MFQSLAQKSKSNADKKKEEEEEAGVGALQQQPEEGSRRRHRRRGDGHRSGHRRHGEDGHRSRRRRQDGGAPPPGQQAWAAKAQEQSELQWVCLPQGREGVTGAVHCWLCLEEDAVSPEEHVNDKVMLLEKKFRFLRCHRPGSNIAGRPAQPAETEHHLRQAFNEYARLAGSEHLGTLQAASWLGYHLFMQGLTREASELLQHAVDGFSKVLGPSHVHTLASIGNLALCLEAQGRVAQALPMFQEALAGFEHARGNCHPFTQATANNLANCLVGETNTQAETTKQGRPNVVSVDDRVRVADAERLYRRAAEAFGAGMGYTSCSLNLVRLLQAIGRTSEAAEVRRSAGGSTIGYIGQAGDGEGAG